MAAASTFMLPEREFFMDKQYTVREFAALGGLTPRALRHYGSARDRRVDPEGDSRTQSEGLSAAPSWLRGRWPSSILCGHDAAPAWLRIARAPIAGSAKHSGARAG